MTAFGYRNGALFAEDVDLAAVAAQVGTPAYVYSSAALVANYRAYVDALAGLPIAVCFAAKANSNLAVLRTLVRQGAGIDVVSTGEMKRALAAGCPPDRIVFSGVGKTAEDLEAALLAGIHQINVESLQELELLSRVAVRVRRDAVVAFRVNPDVDAKTHTKISTGRKGDKFGIELEDAALAYERARALPGVRPVGIAAHIGSQLLDLSPYRDAYRRLAELVRELRGAGHVVERLDLGGGIGISYKGDPAPALADYARIVRETVGDLGCHLMVEPGRSICGDAGVLLSRVIFIKPGRTRNFVILDAAMNDLIRPAMYEAWHGIVPLRQPAEGAAEAEFDVVGPVCESSDTFARARSLPPLAAGDLVAFTGAGAYGAVMASTYNTRPLVPEVLVDKDRFAIVRKRPTFEEMVAGESLPPWLARVD
ncbi:diaminopimelate decarboxylase [Inquilinus sp. Marseille-Q2685]|uniref:diaminopimelate decarboxylase n=1 Tax=Inquilinus sp. Marseille-Q2685 TaxID=2866581 RepID=UPI001CE4177F|nr:diaminopimelate decarboxylase [Inquilinus sp. Marseille-Q2685]